MTTSPERRSDLEVGKGPVLAWSGDDPIAYGRALAALDEAGILSFEVAEHDQFATVPQIAGAEYRVIVSKSDAAHAQKVIRAALQPESKD
jgi:ABC-type metal ion transport system substrate-binding protein